MQNRSGYYVIHGIPEFEVLSLLLIKAVGHDSRKRSVYIITYIKASYNDYKLNTLYNLL